MEWNWEELLDTDFLQGNHSHSTAESASSTTSSTTTNQTSYAAHTETNTSNSHVHKTIPPTTPYETLPASILPINSLPNEVPPTSPHMQPPVVQESLNPPLNIISRNRMQPVFLAPTQGRRNSLNVFAPPPHDAQSHVANSSSPAIQVLLLSQRDSHTFS